MEPWMYGLIAIPVVALGASYGLGAFTTDTSSLKEENIPGLTSKTWKSPTALESALEEEKAVKADQEKAASYQASAGRKRKTKKSKSKNKKTKRRR